MNLIMYCHRRWPNLCSLMTIYFGQDFVDFFGSPEGALRAIFYGTPDEEWAPLSKDELSAVLRELEEFMEFAREYLRKHPEKKRMMCLIWLAAIITLTRVVLPPCNGWSIFVTVYGSIWRKSRSKTQPRLEFVRAFPIFPG
jgi:hypothetical protein